MDTIMPVIKFALLIAAVPLAGVVLFIVVFIFSGKPEEKRMKEGATLLSTKATHWLKIKMPLFFCPVIAVAIIIFAVKTFPKSPKEAIWIEIFFLISVVLLPFMYSKLKEVGYCENYIFITNYFSSIHVPFSNIENIWSKRVGRAGWVVFISFKTKTKFGRKIYFYPYKYEGMPETGEEQPVVTELKNIINKSLNTAMS